MHEKQIGYAPYHAAGEREAVDVGYAVDPDDFCAEQFAQEALQASGGGAGAYYDLGSFAQGYYDASK